MGKFTTVLLLLSLLQLPAFAEPGDNKEKDKDIEVKVQVIGEDVIVDVSFPVPATPREVWAVLTDFDHMTGFVSNLQSSKVLDRSGNTLHIAQEGKAQHGPLSFEFSSVREIQLSPFEKIQSRLITGKIRKLEGLTQLKVEGDGTRVTYHSVSIPGVWIPPVVGKVFIEHETREQFAEVRTEVVRRKQNEIAKK